MDFESEAELREYCKRFGLKLSVSKTADTEIKLRFEDSELGFVSYLNYVSEHETMSLKRCLQDKRVKLIIRTFCWTARKTRESGYTYNKEWFRFEKDIVRVATQKTSVLINGLSFEIEELRDYSDFEYKFDQLVETSKIMYKDLKQMLDKLSKTSGFQYSLNPMVSGFEIELEEVGVSISYKPFRSFYNIRVRDSKFFCVETGAKSVDGLAALINVLASDAGPVILDSLFEQWNYKVKREITEVLNR